MQGLYDLIFNRLQKSTFPPASRRSPSGSWSGAVAPGAPLKPRNLQSLFLAALIGLAIGIGLIFALEFMDDSIRFPEDVVRSLGMPFLGLVPTAHWKQADDASYWLGNVDPSSGFAEAYRNIRSALLLNPSGKPFRTLAVIFGGAEEGKTTTSANLATSFSRRRATRCCWWMPICTAAAPTASFGLQAGRGLSEILTGRATMDQVVQRTGGGGARRGRHRRVPGKSRGTGLRREMKEFMSLAPPNATTIWWSWTRRRPWRCRSPR